MELFFEFAGRPAVTTSSSITALAGGLPKPVAIAGASQRIFPLPLAVQLCELLPVKLEKLLTVSEIDNVVQIK